MPNLITDMFPTALSRDVYFKARDDIGDTFARTLDNFSPSTKISGEVLFPAICALAWTLRAALLSLNHQQGDSLYKLLTAMVIELILTPDEEPTDG